MLSVYTDCNHIIISINWIILVLVMIVVVIFILVLKCKSFSGSILMGKFSNCLLKNELETKSIQVTFGNIKYTIVEDKTIKRTAYFLWLELITRKIGLEFEEDQDVIVEVYNSWYQAFGIIRSTLKELSAGQLENGQQLIDITIKVLNEGLRSHLTRWQAKFRAWYEVEKAQYPGEAPQVIQKRYSEYDLLVADLKKTNKYMMEYAAMLKDIIDGNSSS